MTDPASTAILTSVRLAAMDLLARREHSFAELQDKLRTRFPELDATTVLQPVLERLCQEGLQSDTRFTEAYVHYRASRGMGPARIAQELRQKGIARELLREQLYAEIDWDERCHEVLVRKFAVTAKPTAAERAKWMRFLAQRGFESEQVRAALRRVDADDRSN